MLTSNSIQSPKERLKAIAVLKNELNLNVELASPDNFIPAAPDWRERSQHIATIGRLQFFHYDFSLQALAKLDEAMRKTLKT